jgi:hypothetical protein
VSCYDAFPDKANWDLDGVEVIRAGTADWAVTITLGLAAILL